MSDSLINWFTNNLSFMPKELVVLIISMVPILELRGGIIASSLLGINMFNAIWLCMLGNIIPIPFILLFITPIFTWMKKTKLLSGIVKKLEKKSMSKSEKIQKYEFWGLALFVGIPLPGTGAWTGALIASILGIKVKKASGSILTGIIIATIIMTIISYGIPYAVGIFN
ncbi:COG2426 family protein [Clostridium gasigenes]|uniref:COG2426 family protein n=1 Tax=Clostridium gasigenes TaxID=94869 RepID=UPI001C0CC21D|nr:small multi-drug export protein [Clostridium gasigenes]MBU3107845.1 small multi-drug export protein [Clostridium gasigenes]